MVSFLFAAVHLPTAAVLYGSLPPYQTSHPPVLTNNRAIRRRATSALKNHIRAEITFRARTRFRPQTGQLSCDILVTISRWPANLLTNENSKTL